MTIGKVTNTINGVAHECILLTAAEGKALTNDGGVTVWNCIAVDSADGWTEIDALAPEDEDATEADYIAALNELGVSE